MATPGVVSAYSFPPKLHASIRIALATIALTVSTLSLAQNMTILHNFTGEQGDGIQPAAPPTIAPNGVVYGTVWFGGDLNCPGGVAGVGCGAVFELDPPAHPGGDWTYRDIYEFTGLSDGCCVSTSLTLNSQGKLYGVNASLFQLTPSQKGFWKYKDIFDFSNGLIPLTPLALDGAGALYGVSPNGGSGCNGQGCGAVLQFVPTKHGKWKENVLYQFTGGADGAFPSALAIDSNGNLSGVSSAGGLQSPNCQAGCGTVFELQPTQAGTWTFTVVYSFTGVRDHSPYTSTARDTNGDLFGLAFGLNSATEVFKLKPRRKTPWIETMLHRFSPKDLPVDYCSYSPSYLTEANGVVYGAIFGDIDLYFGALFQLTPPAGGKGRWSYATIWDFNESGPDLNPNGIVMGPDGALYGTTNGGDSTFGTVFRLQLPSLAPWPPTDFCF